MINIAIDGPSGSGKSTLAKLIAKKRGILYLDTGAMYRCVGLKVKETGIDMYNEESLQNLLDNLKLDIKYIDGEQKVFLDGKNVSAKIREHDISKLASDVSALPACRIKLVEIQHQIASRNDCILDGRDIGTFVLPNADVKIFLTADPEVRANRRYKELKAKGQDVHFKTVLRDIIERDRNDSQRAFAPLKKADDACELDTSFLSVEDVLNKIEEIINKKGE